MGEPSRKADTSYPDNKIESISNNAPNLNILNKSDL